MLYESYRDGGAEMRLNCKGSPFEFKGRPFLRLLDVMILRQTRQSHKRILTEMP